MLSPLRAPVRVTPPSPLISIDEARSACGLAQDQRLDDPIILVMAAAAVEHFDGYTGILGGRCLLNQTWRVSLGDWCDRLLLPFDPISSVTSVQYYDTSGVQQTLGSVVYERRSTPLGDLLLLASGASWPSLAVRDDAATVTFVAGYGNSAGDVPAPIRAAVLIKLRSLYTEIKRDPSIQGETVYGVGSLTYASSGPDGAADRAINSLVEPFVRHNL